MMLWNEFKNALRRQFYRPIEKEWDDVLPDKIAFWVGRKLQELKNKYGDNCTDNYRVALVGNLPQERRYRRQQRKGCCGFFDCIDICPVDGRPYRLGFNYGH
jgi:hypothetical protein